MNIRIVVTIAIAACLSSCRDAEKYQRSPLGRVTGFESVRFASSCSAPLELEATCGRNRWRCSANEQFRSVYFDEATRKEHPEAASATSRLGCEDGWAVWMDDYGRVVAVCALENQALGIGDPTESSDSKLKRVVARLFGDAAAKQLAVFRGRPVALPPTPDLHGPAADAELARFPDARLTYRGVWDGVTWWGWTNGFSWSERIKDPREVEERQLWASLVARHRPARDDGREYLEAVRCIEFALPRYR